MVDVKLEHGSRHCRGTRSVENTVLGLGVLGVDARARIGGWDVDQVWLATGSLAERPAAEHGIDLLVVKLALSTRGQEHLKREAAAYARLAQARGALGNGKLTDRVRIPRCFGLFREVVQSQDSEGSSSTPMVALVLSYEPGKRVREALDESMR